MKLEIRFYACLLIATVLLFCGLYLPPVGEIGKSVQRTSAIILIIGALCVGLDIKGILHEIGLIISANNERIKILKEQGNEDSAKSEGSTEHH